MSLISDALRKARQEAARRDARARGEAAPPTAVDRGRPGRLGTVLAAGGAIGLAAAIAGGGAVWWALGRGAEVGGPGSRTGSAAHLEPSPAATRPSLVPAAPDPTAAPPRGAVPTTGPTPPEPAAAAALPASPTPTPTAVASRPPGDHAPELPPTDAPPGSGTGERVFVLEADLGYARLSLGYVIDRPDDPFAEVNGREVHVGSTVDGFVVESITRLEVRLRDARGAVVLRVR